MLILIFSRLFRPWRGFLLLSLAILLIGCGNRNNSTIPDPPDNIRQELQKIITESLAPNNSPGVTIQIVTPQWTWNAAAGNAQLTPIIPAHANMHFRIASVSKMFVAVALCKLAEDGKLSLDDPVEKWLPQAYLDRMANYHQITLRLLLNHRSGIADYDETGVMIPTQREQPTIPLTTDWSIFQGLDQGPLYPPDTGYTYSNINYLLLTRVIDAASGTIYENYIHQIIINPLGLTHTLMTTDPIISTMSEPFMRCLFWENNQWIDYSTIYLLWDRGAGDIVSDVKDLNSFHRSLREGRIISQASLQEMEKFLPPNGYGLGYRKIPSDALNLTVLGHDGGYPGAWTSLFYWVEKDTYFALNQNGNAENQISGTLSPLIRYLQQNL